MHPDLISVGTRELYSAGGFHDGEQAFEELAGKSDEGIRLQGQVFPGFAYSRKPPAGIVTSDDHERSLRARFDEVDRAYRTGAASWLAEVDCALLARNVLYVQREGQRKVVFETYRTPDRADSPLLQSDDPIALFPRERDSIQLFIGSVGSFNYGHWLTDDIARLESFRILRERYPNRTIEILLPSYGLGPEPHFAPWNEIRMDAIRHFLRGAKRCRISIVDVTRAYRFDKLYYATPISYHPVLKCPHAIQLVAERFRTRSAFRWQRSHRRIFVTRRASRGRELENIARLKKTLEGRGFRTVDSEGMSIRDQAALFAKADVVVGVMGAAMTNTLFCNPGTRLIYIGIEGWNEPFYWDLANVSGATYVGCHGPAVPTDGPAHMASFTLPEDRLEKALHAVGEK